MAPVKPTNRPTKAQDATTCKLPSNGPSAGNAHSPQNSTGVTKVLKRRRKKTHPKVLGPLDTHYGSRSDTASPLLALPFEIRRMIWCHALTSSNKRLRYDTNSSKLDLSPIGAALSATCHQIALETRHMPLELNKLCFDVQGFLRCQRRLMSMEGEVEWELMSNRRMNMFGHEEK
ncbi:hypothetical protein P171DRAFT_440941 [Karstenula rhodostoma CBS 690.94]|uniref:Uncharacterized protein n=1 Tax=Karstenula rhodostoma CBS 690.94 TaxID=1392251 RepID=A0A9P4PR02_9PLEO|nr:hypothetical protein P171DRAFT_440941 [Karstenula rhodostoma CBS 690.94]